MPTAKKPAANDEVVFVAIRIPKTMKRQLQQLALDEESTMQALVLAAIEAELKRRAPSANRPRRR